MLLLPCRQVAVVDLGLLVNEGAHLVSADRVSGGRSHFGPVGRYPSVAAGSGFKLGYSSAIPCPKEGRSRSLPGILPPRQTSTPSLLGTNGPNVSSEASPILAMIVPVALGVRLGPAASQSVVDRGPSFEVGCPTGDIDMVCPVVCTACCACVAAAVLQLA